MNKLSIVPSVLILLLVNGCESSVRKDTNATSESSAIVHNGTTYGVVTSKNTGRVWLDRNLGAARVCQSFNDMACYGDYYQWGRNFDGHQDSTSGTTNNQATDLNNTGTDFIVDSGKFRKDWANKEDKNGDKRMDMISSYDGSFICPKDFRIPKMGEFLVETSQASKPVTNNLGAYRSFLKLPSSGLRNGATGKMRIDDIYATYMVSGGNYEYSADYFYYSEDKIGRGSLGSRVTGSTVRCIKN